MKERYRMTLIPDEAVESARRRTGLSAGLRELAAWLDTHPGSPLPDVRATFRIPQGPRGQRVDAVQEVADWLGVPVGEDREGNLLAERRFGPVPAGAGLPHEDASPSGYLARRAARTAAA
jgi:hypothetical protein